MKNILFLFLIGLLFLAGCQSKPEALKKEVSIIKSQVKKDEQRKPVSSLATILLKPEVPILCYHRIRNILPSDGSNMKTYSVTPTAFAQQMKVLSENGFHTILPAQLDEYLTHNGKLPSKPVMITFDDTREEQFTIGAAEMNKYGFKGVFFIMTISINRPKYMTNEQIKSLSDDGNVIGAHSWDHHMVTKYEGADWETQLTKPKKKLEAITGKPVNYFAYPDGIWNQAAITQIQKKGYKLAFILSTKRDSLQPLFTIRRIIVAGTWSTPGFMKAMQSSFNK
jgi:peptidoglycan/xylan/chitin deacetylase (PgdA/CDA1 family)